MLERGDLPIREVARIAAREGRRPRAIYGAHKWFARRLGVVFRSLLIAAHLGPDEDFWSSYYGGCQLNGLTVLDPFVGGGTSVVEARRLGANCIGVDVDPVACAVTSFELSVDQLPQLQETLTQLKLSVGNKLQEYHEGWLPDGRQATALHHFWVQVVSCLSCDRLVHAHPNYVLAEDATTCWSVCRHCGAVERRRAGVQTLRCSSCDEQTQVRDGPGSGGIFTCPHCEHREPLIALGRREGKPPRWHLFAQELFVPGNSSRTVPISERVLVPAGSGANDAYASASRALHDARRSGAIQLPDAPISTVDRNDDRITAYGYRSWLDLFNDRQLLHLGLLRRAIATVPEELQRPLAIAYSNHLTTNCMMAAYAAGWRRLTPLFSVRAFRHIQRPVEINPWVDGTGRGSYPNSVRKLMRAKEFMSSPKEPAVRGGFRSVPAPKVYGSTKVLNRNSEDLSVIEDSSIDVVLTDPPYFDNINYSELSEFFAPWMKDLGLTKGTKATRTVLRQSIVPGKSPGKDAAAFVTGLGGVFSEVRRVLKPDGLVVFTFRHTHADAWASLAGAIRAGGFAPARVFPMPGEAGTGLHTSSGTGLWDAVFVLRAANQNRGHRPLAVTHSDVRRVTQQVREWSKKLRRSAIPFTEVDAHALKAAMLVAESLQAPRSTHRKQKSLWEALASGAGAIRAVS